MNIKRNIIFALESRKKNGMPIIENVPIRMRVIYASQRIEFTTGYRIDVAKWDADKQRVKNGCTNKLKQSASEINADLLKYYAEIQNVFKEFEVQEAMPTTQQLKDAFNLRMKDANEEQQEETQISFWEVFDEFVKECGNQNNWTASTYEKFAAVRNHLKEFKEDVVQLFWLPHSFTNSSNTSQKLIGASSCCSSLLSFIRRLNASFSCWVVGMVSCTSNSLNTFCISA